MGTPGKVVREGDSSLTNIVNALMYHRNAVASSRNDYRAWERFDRSTLVAEAEAILEETALPRYNGLAARRRQSLPGNLKAAGPLRCGRPYQRVGP